MANPSRGIQYAPDERAGMVGRGLAPMGGVPALNNPLPPPVVPKNGTGPDILGDGEINTNRTPTPSQTAMESSRSRPTGRSDGQADRSQAQEHPEVRDGRALEGQDQGQGRRGQRVLPDPRPGPCTKRSGPLDGKPVEAQVRAKVYARYPQLKKGGKSK